MSRGYISGGMQFYKLSVPHASSHRRSDSKKPTKEKPYKIFDEEGLFLLINPSGFTVVEDEI